MGLELACLSLGLGLGLGLGHGGLYSIVVEQTKTVRCWMQTNQSVRRVEVEECAFPEKTPCVWTNAQNGKSVTQRRVVNFTKSAMKRSLVNPGKFVVNMSTTVQRLAILKIWQNWTNAERTPIALGTHGSLFAKSLKGRGSVSGQGIASQSVARRNSVMRSTSAGLH